MIGLGVLLAVVGPLLTLPLIWVVQRLLLKALIQRCEPSLSLGRAQRKAYWVATILVVAVLLASRLPGHYQFLAQCSEHQRPQVATRVQVDGFYRTAALAYEAAEDLRDGRFHFIEAPDPYRAGVELRYSLDSSGAMHRVEIEERQSKFGVSTTYTTPSPGLSVHQKQIFELQSGNIIAEAASLTYDGGPLSWLLGSYAMESCPDPATAQGSENFRIYYDLGPLVLGTGN